MASSRITVFLAAGVYPEVASHIVCDVAGAARNSARQVEKSRSSGLVVGV